ncbi:MAG: hypothetical protein CMI26_13365 [Opitutae bacterium]|nr:hypothetical protein [Opitutae bacterium]
MNTKKLRVPPRSGDPLAFSAGLMAALIAYLVAPELLAQLLPKESRLVSSSREVAREVEVTWDPVYLSRSIKPRFVEANPDAPENPPDETDNFSFREQQAAQAEEVASESASETPKIEGDKPNSQKIVPDGDPVALAEPPPSVAVDPQIAKDFERGSPVGKDEDTANPPEARLELEKVDDDEGKTVKKVEAKENDTDSRRQLVLTDIPDKTLIAALEQPTARPKPKHTPRPRPRISADLIRGPIMSTVANAPRLGKVAIECRLHPYGAYVQEMLQAIEDQWAQLAHGSRQFLRRDRLPPKVTLRFTLDSDGRIHKLHRLHGNGESVSVEICRQAIVSREPFGKWSAKMIEDFGTSDEVTINFLYR